MTYKIAKVVVSSVAGAGATVHVDGDNRRIKCETIDQANHIASCLEYALHKGRSDAKREVRNALGIHDWGGRLSHRES